MSKTGSQFIGPFINTAKLRHLNVQTYNHPALHLSYLSGVYPDQNTTPRPLHSPRDILNELRTSNRTTHGFVCSKQTTAVDMRSSSALSLAISNILSPLISPSADPRMRVESQTTFASPSNLLLGTWAQIGMPKCSQGSRKSCACLSGPCPQRLGSNVMVSKYEQARTALLLHISARILLHNSRNVHG